MLACFVGRPLGMQLEEQVEGVILSTGHLSGTEQLHPLADCGFTLWQKG